MKNKKVLITVLFSVICAAVILTVILIANDRRTNTDDPIADPDANTVHTVASLEETADWSEFPLQCTDRLNGILATEYSADKNVITVKYGDAGLITKTLITEAPSDAGLEDPEENGFYREINGVTVRFTGEEDAVTKAEWTDNGFDYAITLTEGSVTADTMSDYVSATR